MSAVCVKCGGEKGDYASVCPSCGNRPEGEGLVVAWLASTENLDEQKLRSLASMIQAGEVLRPNKKMLRRARRALGRQIATDPGLSLSYRAAILACSLLFTPLVGFTCFVSWREERPRAAYQALGLSLPVSALFSGLWFYAIFLG